MAPNQTGDALQATAVAGTDAEGVSVPFVTPGSGAIQAFTSATDRFAALRGAKPAQELAPAFDARGGPLAADSPGQEHGGRGSRGLLA